ncbi:MAG: HD domain-containing protein [Oscillospiraceae bacterium]|nr:HD domain-containing protein [Oscillospiraceae bacterium]
MIRFPDIQQSKKIRTYIEKADETLSVQGFTDHSFPHVTKVAMEAGDILRTMGYSEREAELAQIAGFLHDIGNVVNRTAHAQTGALIAFRLLEDMGGDPEEIATIITAIGNHDEGTSAPVNPVCAAVILADKSDVRRTRVRNRDIATFDIHDRVNHAVTGSALTINETRTEINLDLEIDTAQCAVMDYFEIFLHRMTLCRRAADMLGLRFTLTINGHQLL